jgi:GlcNAc-P-P-Und epimerase
VYKKWAMEDPSRTLVIVRPTVVFGEGNRGNVYNLIRQVASGRFLMVGSGRNVKSMSYVGNVASFLTYALDLPPGVHVFNYVDGPDMDVDELVQHLRRVLEKSGPLPRIPRSIAMLAGHAFDALARASGQTFSVSAIRVRKFCESTQFRSDRVSGTGFVPPYSLVEALERTIRAEFPQTVRAVSVSPTPVR